MPPPTSKMDNIINAWANSAGISEQERAKLGLTEAQTKLLNEDLGDFVITIEEARELAEIDTEFLRLHFYNPWKPLEQYVEFVTDADDRTYAERIAPIKKLFTSSQSQSIEKDFLPLLIEKYTDLLERSNWQKDPTVQKDIRQMLPIFFDLTSPNAHETFLFPLAKIDLFPEILVPLLDDEKSQIRQFSIMLAGLMKCEASEPLWKKIEEMAKHDLSQAVREEATGALNSTSFICHNSDKEQFFTGDPIPFKGTEREKHFNENGLASPKHPMFGIINYMANYGNIDDFRSAEAFENPELLKQLAEFSKDRREITILYPASGSQMTPLSVPFNLIDADKIDRAKLIYTEIDPRAVNRIELYLGRYKNEGLIENLTVTRTQKGKGVEHNFQFTYKGKSISLIYALNCGGGELWASKEYIRESDLVIFHDGIYDSDKMRATKFINTMDGMDNKRRLVLSEKQWKPNKNELTIGKRKYHYLLIPGAYGCNGNTGHSFYSKRVFGNKIITDERPSSNRSNPFDLKPNFHPDLPKDAYLIDIK